MNRAEFLSLLSMTPFAFIGVSPFVKELAVKEEVAFRSEEYKNLYNPSDFEGLLIHDDEEIGLLKNNSLTIRSEEHQIVYEIESQFIVSDDYQRILDLSNKGKEFTVLVVKDENTYLRFNGILTSASILMDEFIMSGTIRGFDSQIIAW